VFVIETETLLEKCPRCGAWPMAAKLPKASSHQVDIRLRCPQCGYQEGGRFRRADYGRSFAKQRPQAGG
jgi:ribosomal protein S27AE